MVSPPPEVGLSSSCVDPVEGDLSPAAGDDVGGEGAVGTLLAGGVRGDAEATGGMPAALAVCSSDLRHCAMTSSPMRPRASIGDGGPPGAGGGGGGGKRGCLPAANCAAAATGNERRVC